MRRRNLIFLYLSIGIVTLLAVPVFGQGSQDSVPVIFDSDMGPDYDDVGAMALLHALADSGEAEILATVGSNRYPQIAAVFDVLNTYFNRPDIPVGIPKGPSVEMKDWQGWSNAIVAKYPHSLTSNNDVRGSVEIYREQLSQQSDSSVTIITVGFLTNLARLLESGPDQYSNLTGRELIAKKVDKVVSMAGKFPAGEEFNVLKDIPAADFVFDHWPTEIIFSGFDIGVKLKTGIPLIKNNGIHQSPVKDTYQISIPKSAGDKNGRSSWDQTAVLVAIRGASPYYHKVPGRIHLNHEGRNEWDSTGTGQFYLIETKPVAYMQKMINELMQHQPKQKKAGKN